jgi:preprotein translocase SecA subunit
MLNWLKKLSGDTTLRVLDETEPLVEAINALEPQFKALTDAEMRSQTAEFRRKLAEGTAEARQGLAEKRVGLEAEPDPDQRIALREEWKQARRDLFAAEQDILDEILPQAFALVREAAVRTIGQRHYDVQLVGGIVLHKGMIAEMKTGEGKTLTSTLPLYLNALVGRGAHLVTVNDYLARRDCGWMGQIFYHLGLSTAVIMPDFSGIYDPTYTDETVPGHDERLMHLRPCSRIEAYRADITYGTNNEFGFDYLRDNMAYSLNEAVQQELYYAIVDEIDNILIDEARTPLIISSPDTESYQQYLRFARIAHNLNPADYEIEEKDRVVTLTEDGVDSVERQLGINHDRGESLYDENHAELTFFLEASLKARFLFKKDVDYVVQDGQIVIVDEFTGRLMPGRRWSDGIHEAIEAKEKVIYGEQVEVQRESKTFATITFQNLFRLYDKLSGMTGTAATEQEEFFKIYGLNVAVVPTNKPVIRDDSPDHIYAREQAKYDAVVREIAQMHELGRPVLVGTTSVEKSEYLSRLLKRQRIPHQVLNAKRHTEEALIVAQAGEEGAVTIATNMAGRGVDIILGGDPANRADQHLQRFAIPKHFIETVTQIPLAIYRREEATPQFRDNLPQELRKQLRHTGVEEHFLQDLVKWVHDAIEEFQQARSRLGQLNNRIRPLLQERLVEKLQHQADLPDQDLDVEIVHELADRIASEQENPDVLLKWARAQGLSHQFVEEAQVDFQYCQDVRAGHNEAIVERLHTDYQNALTRLIRAVLGKQIDLAGQIVSGHPALPPYYIQELQEAYEAWIKDFQKIHERGGLHVIGTERHDARRIDNQLRGRAGRQGDPGSSRFYVSTEDELIRRFGPGADRMRAVLERFSPDDEIPIEARVITRMIDQAQTSVDGHHFDVRKHLVEYDDVLNRQREVIYAERRRILAAENVHGLVLSRLREEIADRVAEAYEALEQIKEYDRDRETIEAALGTLVEGMQRGRQSRESSRMPLFPIISQLIVEYFRQQPAIEPYSKVQEVRRALLRSIPALETIRTGLEEAAEAVRSAGHADMASELREMADSLDEQSPQSIVERLTAHVPTLEKPATEALQAGIEEVIEAALRYRHQRHEEFIAKTMEEYLYGELQDESGLHLTQLHRMLTKDLRVLLPATSTTAKWAQKEPEAIEEEVLEVVRKQSESQLNRDRQRILEKVPLAIHAWQDSAAGWWIIVDFLGEVDRFYRLPSYLATESFLDSPQEEVEEDLYQLAVRFLEDRERRLGTAVMRQIEQSYLLRAIDREWVDYLTAMQDLRQGISLQAYGQRDPLVEYRRQSFHLFQRLLERVREQALFYVFQASQAPVQRQSRPDRSQQPEQAKSRTKKRHRKKGARPKSAKSSGKSRPRQRRRRRKK